MKKIIFTILMTGVVFSGTAYAVGGQGGIAGSSSMIMSSGVVTDVSASIAIGKSAAHSNAHTTNAVVSTFAGGAGGELTVDATGYLTAIDVEDATNLAADQSNDMVAGTVSLDAKAGTFAGQASTP